MNSPQNKSKSFKEAALSHIPIELRQSMLHETTVSTEGMGVLEAIAKNISKPSAFPTKSSPDTPEQFITVAIDNIAIKVSTDPYKAMQTLFAFLLATVWHKNKKIKKILKAFNFSFQDINGATIYPKNKK